MVIPTHQSLSGFIATDPQMSFTRQDEARFSARVGVRHGRRLEDGTFEELPPTFHSMVMFGRSAERAYEQFKKGDSFVADGRVREFTYESGGQQQSGEEFVARKIGHDSARSRVTIDRTPTGDREPAVAQATTEDGPHADAAPQEPAPPLADLGARRPARASASTAAVGI
jgi:single-strand DNA-binding protein